MADIASVVVKLQAALAEAQAVPAAPPIDPPPVVVPPPASSFPQYLLDDSGLYGPTRYEWSQELMTPWPAAIGNQTWQFGNWLDANDAPQGPTAYQTLMVGPATPKNAYLESDVTTLARKWQASGHNKGVYLRSESTPTFTAFAQVSGRLSPNPPQLVVVTDAGTTTLTGTLAAWATSSSQGIDTRQTAKLTKGTIGLVHFPDFAAITGTIQSATLRLFVTAAHASAVLSLQLMQTDAPYCPAGADGEAPVMGLAAQVGEANLPSHPDVYQAGDFRQSNWVTFKDSNGAWRANRANPSPLGTQNTIPSDIQGFEFGSADDPDYPGTQYLRASMVHGDGRTYATSSISFTGQHGTLPNLADPLRAIDPATVINEIYTRCYMLLEADFASVVDGVKGGLGIDARCGYWADGNGGYWQQTTGNSGTKGTGLKIVSTKAGANGRYEYQGHSMRQHMGDCRPSGTPYQDYRPALMMVSHLGPYENAPYGTEEIRRCGTAVLQKRVQNCVEWRLKMNSIDLSAPDALGNGIARNDGIMELWINGVHRWAKTDFAWRRHPEMGINGAWIIWMHGGLVPAAPGEVLHYRLNSFVSAKHYIGPRA